MELRPVSYKLKGTDNKDIGFIAQDVKKIIPEIVYGSEGELTLSYGQITSVLTKGMQEQQKEIENYKTEIADLQSQVKSLREEVDKITSSLAPAVNR